MINKLKSTIAASRLRKREIRQAELRRRLNFPELFTISASAQSYVPRFKYSVVTAAYGVESYIDDFFSSLIQQTIGFEESIEVVVVDDGSLDSTLEKAKVWASRYPGSIKVLTQNNSGPAEARNTGLKHISHDWVTFIDPDDFLAKNYFECVDREISRNLADGLSIDMVSCRLTIFNEVNGWVRHSHALDKNFQRGNSVVDLRQDIHDELTLSAASAFFRRERIVDGLLSFPDVRPSFEDAMFIARYLQSGATANQLFVSNANYFYRKRDSNNSLVDTAWSKKEKYSDQIRFGYLALLKQSISDYDQVPRWAQRTVFYDLVWHFKLFFNNHKNWALVPEDLRLRYFELLEEVFSYIDSEVIKEFELAKLTYFSKLAILNRYKHQPQSADSVRVLKVDSGKREVLLGFYHCNVDGIFKIFIGGQEIEPLTQKNRRFDYFDEPVVYENLAWIKWRGDGVLSCQSGGTQIPIQVNNHKAMNVGWHEVVTGFKSNIIPHRKIPTEKKLIRFLALQSVVQQRFQNAWLLMDRDTQADDNAEHLYRFLMKNHPELNAWFVLRRSSHDWDRLKKDGFRLLEYGSVSHKLALINADHLISSHADHYLFSVLPDKFYSDLIKYKFTFLQHGVIKDDLSGWLNAKDIKLFVTTAVPEYQSIVKSGPYKFTQKAVALTGMPRHDRLYEMSHNRTSAKKKTILIMPTWRQGLAGEILGLGNSRAYNPEFIHSEFFKNWQAFLVNERLVNLIEMSDVDIVFYPHANLTPYIKDFQIKGMKVVSHSDGGSIQDYLVDADLLVTDFSSIAFESGFLGKSIVYFQFDRDRVFSGGHLYRKGYFEYDEHGFGPVALNVDALMKHIESIIDNNFVPSAQYSRRMSEFFAYRDAGSCERVYHRIKALDSAEPSIIDAVPVK